MRHACVIGVVLCGACVTPRPVGQNSDSDTVAFRFVEDRDKGVLRVYEGDAPVLAYAFGDQLLKGVPEDRTRSSYVQTIYGLDGEQLTDDFPKDHHHHRGLSLMWPRMQVAGKKVELWHIKGIRSYFRRFRERKAHPDKAVLVVENEWKLDDGRKVASEELTLVVHAATDVGRAIDVGYRLLALEESITIQGQVGKGYGGLNLRFAPRKDTQLTTDSGRQAKDSDKKPHAWADLSARFGGSADMSGIAVFVDGGHPGFPPPWTLRHYGDLNVAWPGLTAVKLVPKKPVELSYRLWVHRGDAASGNVAEAYRAFRER